MKNCVKCGKQIEDYKDLCPYCGARQLILNNEDAKSFGFAFLGFLLPIVGLVLYLVWKDSSPLKASSCGKGALTGFILSVISVIIYVVSIGKLIAGQY